MPLTSSLCYLGACFIDFTPVLLYIFQVLGKSLVKTMNLGRGLQEGGSQGHFLVSLESYCINCHLLCLHTGQLGARSWPGHSRTLECRDRRNSRRGGSGQHETQQTVSYNYIQVNTIIVMILSYLDKIEDRDCISGASNPNKKKCQRKR